MSDLLEFLLDYGYIVAFAAAFVEQMGVPIPASTLLIGMGALSRSGDFVPAAVVATGAIAALLADLIWFELGRFYGRSVLRLLCRVSLEPAYCVRRTEDAYERMGLWTLFPAKFIPGLNAASIPLAGMMKTPRLRFLVLDLLAVTVWSGTYTLLGYVFSNQIERVIAYVSRFGASMLVVAAAALGVYIFYKVRQRRKFLRTLSVVRITPEELKARMDANEHILILDLRNRLDRNTDPVRIPGAFHVLPEHIDFRSQDLAPGQDVVVYCTCPNEATSARVARQLQLRGLTRVRPLAGGLDAWRKQDFPVEVLD